MFAFDAINTQKTVAQIIESENHYLGALKGNQSGLLKDVQAHFQTEGSYTEVNKRHGRIEHRTVSICQTLGGIRPWAELCSVIRVEATRHQVKGVVLQKLVSSGRNSIYTYCPAPIYEL